MYSCTTGSSPLPTLPPSVVMRRGSAALFPPSPAPSNLYPSFKRNSYCFMPGQGSVFMARSASSSTSGSLLLEWPMQSHATGAVHIKAVPSAMLAAQNASFSSVRAPEEVRWRWSAASAPELMHPIVFAACGCSTSVSEHLATLDSAVQIAKTDLEDFLRTHPLPQPPPPLTPPAKTSESSEITRSLNEKTSNTLESPAKTATEPEIKAEQPNASPDSSGRRNLLRGLRDWLGISCPTNTQAQGLTAS